MEAISQAGSAVGILATDGVVIAAEKRITSQLLDIRKSTEKTYIIDDHISCAVAGISADANILINYARMTAQRYYATYSQPIPVEQLLQSICDLKQSYTQFGGLRPFGVSFLFIGWDEHYGFQLYQSDPSGNYGGWKATAIGANYRAAESLLKTDYKIGEIDVKEGLLLAMKVLGKTMDTTFPTPEKLEVATITRNATGQVKYHLLTKIEVENLLNDAIQKGILQRVTEATSSSTTTAASGSS